MFDWLRDMFDPPPKSDMTAPYAKPFCCKMCGSFMTWQKWKPSEARMSRGCNACNYWWLED